MITKTLHGFVVALFVVVSILAVAVFASPCAKAGEWVVSPVESNDTAVMAYSQSSDGFLSYVCSFGKDGACFYMLSFSTVACNRGVTSPVMVSASSGVLSVDAVCSVNNILAFPEEATLNQLVDKEDYLRFTVADTSAAGLKSVVISMRYSAAARAMVKRLSGRTGQARKQKGDWM